VALRDLVRKYGVSISRRCSRFDGLRVLDARRLKARTYEALISSYNSENMDRKNLTALEAE